MRELVRYILVPALVGGAVGLGVMLTSQVNGTPTKPGYAAAVKRAAPGVVNLYSSKLVQHPMCEMPRFRDWCERFPGLVLLRFRPKSDQRVFRRRVGQGAD